MTSTDPAPRTGTASPGPGGPVVAVLTTPETAHGLNRYAGVLADGLTAAGARVQRVEVPTTGPLASARAAWAARGADVTHLQFTDRYLGSATRQVLTAVALRTALLGRPLVVTAHDFHTPRAEVLAARRRRARGSLRARLRRRAADAGFDTTARLLLGSAADVLTCSAREGELLGWARPRRRDVVPHYVEEPVEEPAAPGSGSPAPRDPDPRRLVVAGFIHRRKGQHLAVAALPELPGQTLVLAGAATGRNAAYLAEIEALARELGVADRLRVTGFLSEEDMVRELRTARLALAPYQRIAASGSIATLIAHGVPLVARASAYTEELAAACPTAVTLFDSEDPRAVAAAVRAGLDHPVEDQRRELRAFAATLSPRTTAERHLRVYRSLVTDTKESRRR